VRRSLGLALLAPVICVLCSSCGKEHRVNVSDFNKLVRSNSLVFAVTEASCTNYDGLTVEDLAAIRITSARWVGKLPLAPSGSEKFVVFENPALELLVKNSIQQTSSRKTVGGEWILSLKPSTVFVIEPLGGTTNGLVKRLKAQHVWVSSGPVETRNAREGSEPASQTQ
jgi:hypothetical protein